MSYRNGPDLVCEYGPYPGSLSESESYIEHQAALDATVFRSDRPANELILELDAGEWRVRRAL